LECESARVSGQAEEFQFVIWSGVEKMLETVAVILIVLWLLGIVSSYTMGGFIHILLVVAIVVILIRVVQGRRL
jgi:hypothetical protein